MIDLGTLTDEYEKEISIHTTATSKDGEKTILAGKEVTIVDTVKLNGLTKGTKYWFNEWNTRGKVIIWDIKQFFHKENQTVVEWYFKNEMNTGSVEEFDGISLIEWTEDNKIKSLKEYGCNLNNYNPYQHSDNPQFRDEKTNWF